MSDSKDLWELGQVKGRQDERERIIKLLESLDCNKGPNCDDEVCFYYQTPTSIIALIKGEK